MSNRAASRQLSAADAVFLGMESGNTPSHIGSLAVLDPSTRPGFDFDTLVQLIGRRIALVPRFTWKLQEVPLGVDSPYWVPDPGFRVTNHVRRAALPQPGTERELHALAGRLHAHPLDRSRPLWEIVLIEGLADGRLGLYVKIHHCLMDGTSGAGLLEVLPDLTPDADAPMIIPDAYQEAPPAPPRRFEIAARAVSNAAGRARRLRLHALQAAAEWVEGRIQGEAQSDAPRLFFNEAPGPRRGIATASLPLAAVKELRKHFDVKLNDVVLELVASAMRRYLAERGELPDAPLVALCPVSLRGADDVKLENRIANMAISLPTECADPTDRLRRIARDSQLGKRRVARGQFDWMVALGESLAPSFVSGAKAAVSALGERAPLPGNFVVSNVRGTPRPIYFAGARVDSMMPMSLLSVNQCLNITVISYMDRIDVGITYDPDRVPDAAHLAEGMALALEELENAAEGVRRQTA